MKRYFKKQNTKPPNETVHLDENFSAPFSSIHISSYHTCNLLLLPKYKGVKCMRNSSA